MAEYRYRPAWWLPGGHLQTLWGKFVRRRPRILTRLEMLEAADGDSLELHHIDGARGSPRVVLLHGLEGSRESHYVGGMLAEALRRNWGATLLVFRGCGSAANHARRFYHSGETTDLELVMSTLGAREPAAPMLVAGVSLGANVLLKWLGEGSAATRRVRAAAAVSAPFDLEAGARKISQGFSRIYDLSFLRSLRRKALRKLSRYPDLFDAPRLNRARNVFEFDDAVTAPVHGFESATDYYSRSSSLGFLERITASTLLLSAENDPFLPVSVLERVRSVAASNPRLSVEFVPGGGHVGFVGGPFPWRARYYAEERVFRFFDAAMERAAAPGYD
jgi:predicted alpha/beta-fold hydrolase